jgi:pimeloyl-ACP methyl ester carboxylesterase
MEPARWSRVVGLAVPPGDAFLMALLTNRDQIRRSWYMFFFLHPLADMVVPGEDLAFVDELWAAWSPGLHGGAELERAKESLRSPEHLAAALGYYRATLSPEALAATQGQEIPMPPQPLLYLHGDQDGAVGVEVTQTVEAAGHPNVRCEVVEGTGHFLHLERPDVVNRLVIGHLAGG